MKPISLAGGIICNQAGELLLIHRNNDRGQVQWETPGGKVEKGETLEAAAIRELKEELGVEVSLRELLGQSEFQANGKTYSYTWFEAILTDDSQIKLEPGFDAYEYFSNNKLQTIWDQLSPGTQTFIKLREKTL